MYRCALNTKKVKCSISAQNKNIIKKLKTLYTGGHDNRVYWLYKRLRLQYASKDEQKEKPRYSQNIRVQKNPHTLQAISKGQLRSNY